MSIILGPTAFRTTRYEPEASNSSWDGIQARVVGRADVDTMRNRYPTGKSMGGGLGFFVDSVRCGPDGPGMAYADVSLKGLWKAKKWGVLVTRTRTDSPSGIKIPAVNAFTVWGRTNILIPEPGYIVYAFDGTAPSQTNVGKMVTAPNGGLSFPPMSQASNPYNFNGVSAAAAVINFPFGWVFEGCEVSEQIGTLYSKAYHYTWRYQYTP